MTTAPKVDARLVEIHRKLWTRDEAHALVDLGFPHAERLELIDGELIDRMGKKHPHVLWLHLIAQWLRAAFHPEHVWSESPIDVAAGPGPDGDLQVGFASMTRILLQATCSPWSKSQTPHCGSTWGSRPTFTPAPASQSIGWSMCKPAVSSCIAIHSAARTSTSRLTARGNRSPLSPHRTHCSVWIVCK